MKKEEELIIKLLRNNFDITLEIQNLMDVVDWKVLFDKLKLHRIFNYIYKRIYNYIPVKDRELYTDYSEFYKKRIHIYSEELKNVLSLAKECNVEIVPIKGLILSQIIYGNVYERDFGDLDIVVKDNLIKLKHQMNTIGFFHYYKLGWGGQLELKEPSNDIHGAYHEFTFCKKLEEFLVKIELKFCTSAIREEYIKNFYDTNMVVDVLGNSFKTFDIVHTFLHLCSNAYGNSESRFSVEKSFRLREYIDLYEFISRYEIDWLEIYNLSEKYNIIYRVYYVLQGINSIYGDIVSKDIIEMFGKNIDKAYRQKDGAIVDWNITFLERLFMDGFPRFVEYERLYYDRQFTDRNLNNKEIIKIKEYSDDELTKPDSYETMKCEKDYDFKFKYKFLKKDDTIVIPIKIDNKYLDNFSRMFIDFNILTKPNNMELKLIRLMVSDDYLYSIINNRITIIDNIIKAKDYIIVMLEVDRKYFEEGWRQSIEPYNVYVFSRLYSEGNPIMLGVKYGDKGNALEAQNLGFIELK